MISNDLLVHCRNARQAFDVGEMKTMGPRNNASKIPPRSESPNKPWEHQELPTTAESRALARRAARKAAVAAFGPIALPPEKDIKPEAKRTRKDARLRVKAYREWVKRRFPARAKELDCFTGNFVTDIRQSLQDKNPNNRLPMQPKKLVPFLPYFDWRLAGIVPPVRNQTTRCLNGCWAFTATAAFESALMKNHNRYKIVKTGNSNLPVTSIALSVQGVLDCVKSGDCDGGMPGDAFNHFLEDGACIQKIDPRGLPIRGFGMGKKGRCTSSKQGTKAVAWDFIADDPREIPSVQLMKETLLTHGPLAVCLKKGERFDNFKGARARGVFNETTKGDFNHTVLLTGWDDKKRAWIIQNSAGRDWGVSCITTESMKISPTNAAILNRQKGCMYIGWASSQIGKFAAWIEAPFEVNVNHLGMKD